MKCKHENVTLYADDEFNHLVGAGHRCVTCFEEFQPASILKGIQDGIVLLVQQEHDDYAPNEPPHHISEFIEALKEVVNE